MYYVRLHTICAYCIKSAHYCLRFVFVKQQKSPFLALYADVSREASEVSAVPFTSGPYTLVPDLCGGFGRDLSQVYRKDMRECQIILCLILLTYIQKN